jgi:rod shape determining protein RodA
VQASEGNIFQRLDWLTIFLYLLLVTGGWFAIYATDFNPEQTGGLIGFTSSYGKQLIWIIVAGTVTLPLLLTDSNIYTTFSYPVYAGVILLLIGVLLFGVETAGSRSWFQIGGLKIQPAEFAKFATCLAIARFLSRRNANIQTLKDKIIVTGLLGLPAGLIILQGDVGSALVYTCFIIVMFREGLSPFYLLLAGLIIALFILALIIDKYLLVGVLVFISIITTWWLKAKNQAITPILIGLILCVGFVFGVDYVFNELLEPHQQKRIQVLLGVESDIQGAAYNVTQSKIAIGSGGLWGKGFLQGTQTKFNFVPEQSTDFIFCTIGEEQGFLGSSLVIGLFALLLLRLTYLAERQRSAYSRIYGYGVIAILFTHCSINIGMTIGLAPVIGIPLPFFSYGGSNLLAFTILLFIFLRLDADRNRILV